METYRIDWLKIGNRIAEMRLSRHLSQMELAELTGLSVNYIGYLEQGKRHGTLETYALVVSVLGYSLDDLVSPELRGSLLDCAAWELTRAMDECDEEGQQSIVRIVRDMARMIRLFRSG